MIFNPFPKLLATLYSKQVTDKQRIGKDVSK